MRPRPLTLTRVGFAIGLLVAGGFGCLQAFSTTIIRYNPAAVLVMGRKDTPTGRSATAQMALLIGQPGTAIALARASLAARPLDPATLRTLALAQLRGGAVDDAARTLTLASQLGWRDRAMQKLLLGFALRAGDVNAAAIRIDALARQKIDPAGTVAAMRAMLLLPGAAEALAQRLAERPAWRIDFLRATDDLPQQAYAPWMAMLAELARLHAPAAPEEINVFERTLIAKSQPTLAITASRRFGTLGSPSPSGLERVFQGLDLSPFVWAVSPGREGSVTQERPGAITVTSQGQNRQALISRIFPIAPGEHVLKMRVTDQAGDADRAFAWSVKCLSASGELPTRIRSQPVPDGNMAQIAFTVPSDCTAASVTLIALPGQLPRQYSATISDLRID
ncbi:hypothetical protein [Novosphingobium album (ex Liu et al. 2023)]|uniref:Tetratricopeptide repeat protein n=1 Tax=Novosphingobium album (ex Liu et al. 2023) TaxID=3031130 RepID=A0ABT5WKP0_9SPHN|nr:hypothetical protein [Novosphingobium album (ex Liu et al. 2023)]MDE8650474.1 hypothetical protein [Novosphingobium album (ex Liu et al. 2023)]